MNRPLFGDGEEVTWPAAGYVNGGHLWALQNHPCGAPVVRPGKTGTDTTPDALFDLVEDAPDEQLQLLPTPTPTPTARTGQGRGTPNPDTAARRITEEGRRNLEDAVALLPTPIASDVTGTGHGAGGGLNLRTAVTLLPTPTARDAKRGAGWGETQTGRPLSEVIVLLSPRLMPTPRASDAEKGGPNQRGSSGDLALPAAVQPGRFGAYEAAVRRQEVATGLVAPEPTEPGRLGKPRLSAGFPEWMMGLPQGWITDHVDRRSAIRIAGNGVVPQCVAHAVTRLTPILNTWEVSDDG